jgi:CheY-like chemotaxis protein
MPTTRLNKLVIVAEDEPLTQKIAIGILEGIGYQTLVCGNGKLCIDALASGAKPDLLLLDLDMPEMNGFDVLNALTQRGMIESFPIMMLTAKTQQDIVIRALMAGAHDYVVKPFNAKELTHRVTDLVFNVDETKLREIFSHLRTSDPSLFRTPGLASWSNRGYKAYAATHDGKALCVLLPDGAEPQALVKESFAEIIASVHIFRRCAYGWRKVWPTYSTKRTQRAS